MHLELKIRVFLTDHRFVTVETVAGIFGFE